MKRQKARPLAFSPRLSQKRGIQGQINLSFGMIVSIILIIVFLAFAFYAIRTFLGIQESAETAKFINDLEADIETVWKSAESSQVREYSMPSRVGYVCFADFARGADVKGLNQNIYEELRKAYSGSENMVFYPVSFSKQDSFEIKNIDIDSMTENENPFCVEKINGKIRVALKKDFGENLVTITR